MITSTKTIIAGFGRRLALLILAMAALSVAAQPAPEGNNDADESMTLSPDAAPTRTESVDGTAGPRTRLSVDGTADASGTDSVDGTAAARGLVVDSVDGTAGAPGCENTGSVDGTADASGSVALTLTAAVGTESVDGTATSGNCAGGRVIVVPASDTSSITRDGW